MALGALVLSLTAVPASTAAAAPSAGLQVTGNQVLLDGVAFQPRGFTMVAALGGACTQPDAVAAASHFSAAELSTLVTRWHMNTVRFQVSQKALAGPTGAAYLTTTVEPDVAAAESAGLVVVLSMQDQGSLACGDGNTMPTQSTEDAWALLAPAYASDHRVMLELFNEPVAGSTSPVSLHPLPAADWVQWHDGGSLDNKGNPEVGFQGLVAYVRSLGAGNVLVADGLNKAGILPGPNQGGYLLTDTLAGPEIAYAIHPYYYVAGAADWDFRFGAVSASVPVIATEWNYHVADCGTAAQTMAPGFLSYLSAHGIGVLGFAGDGPLLPSPGLMADWSSNPTTCGTASSGPGVDFLAYLVTPPSPPGGQYHPVTPARLLDTRVGAPAGVGQVAPGGQVALSPLGSGGVPATDVDAVILDVTVTDTNSAGNVTAYPSGTTRPTSSNVSYGKGATVANLVVVKVGDAGQVMLYDAGGRVDLVVDVEGWYSTAATDRGAAGLYNALVPSRVLDTRSKLGGSAPGPGGTVSVLVRGVGGVPATGVSAVTLNLTATGGTASTYVTAYPSGSARPLASNLNVQAKKTVANRVVVGVGPDGKVTFFNAAGTQQLVVDVAGWFTDGTDLSAPGGYFTAVTPHRVLDTRSGVGGTKGPVQGGHVVVVPVDGTTGVPAAGGPGAPTAVVVDLMAAAPTLATYLTAFPSGSPPLASDLSAAARQTVANLAIVRLASDGTFRVFNAYGSSQVVVDVVGYVSGGLV